MENRGIPLAHRRYGVRSEGVRTAGEADDERVYVKQIQARGAAPAQIACAG